MRKYKLLVAVALLASAFFMNLYTLEKVNASTDQLENIHITVFINKDGSARIIEKRLVQLSTGTENYIVIENLGKSEIEDFVVKEDGKVYEHMDKWDLDASQEEKAFKNGIIRTKDGYELCWGIGSYGKHEYIVEYTVTNFIKQLQDSQILFWRFVNDQTNIPPSKVTVEIQSDTYFSEENQKIWGFGFSGEINFNNGKIIAKNNNPLNQNEYVTVLVKFPEGMFTTGDHLKQSFEEIKDKAFEGSDFGKSRDDERKGSSQKTGNIIIVSLIAGVGFMFLTFAFIAVLIIFIYNASTKNKMKHPKVFKKKYREEYYRDYPYNGSFLDVHYIPYTMGLSNFQTVLTAFLLKWIKEDRILIDTEQTGSFSKRYVPTIYFLNKDINSNTLEGKLFHILLQATKGKDILKEKEFTHWIKNNSTALSNWEDNLFKESLRKLEGSGHIELMKEQKFMIKRDYYELTATGREIEKKIYQYVNYLHDFSLLNEHEAVNVKIWDEIMIWAAFLGLTDVVMKQFTSLYPNYVEETLYTNKSIFLTAAL